MERIFGKTCKKCSETVESSEGGGWAGGGGGAGDTGRGGGQLWSNEQILGTSPAPAPALSFINSRPKNRLITMDLRNIIHNGGNVVTNYF